MEEDLVDHLDVAGLPEEVPLGAAAHPADAEDEMADEEGGAEEVVMADEEAAEEAVVLDEEGVVA